MTKDNPFQDFEHTAEEGHPIDILVERRYPQEDLLGKIRAVCETLSDSLCEDKTVLLELEALVNDYRVRRQEDYFNVGYQHGIIAGGIGALRMLRGDGLDQKYEIFSEKICNIVFQSGLPSLFSLAALLETACSLLLARAGRNDC
ncbi:MAG: hypothetical protein GY847_23805 [Proteobacteria bacterium]|nr:hypothetical protein [Pseudomonadota bacterium]